MSMSPANESAYSVSRNVGLAYTTAEAVVVRKSYVRALIRLESYVRTHACISEAVVLTALAMDAKTCFWCRGDFHDQGVVRNGHDFHNETCARSYERMMAALNA